MDDGYKHIQESGQLGADVEALYWWVRANDERVKLSSREGEILRVMKIVEEAGEVAQAITGAIGQNPRKGVTHYSDDIANELCDVALTALVALADYKRDPIGHFQRFVERAKRRADDAL